MFKPHRWGHLEMANCVNALRVTQLHIRTYARNMPPLGIEPAKSTPLSQTLTQHTKCAGGNGRPFLLPRKVRRPRWKPKNAAPYFLMHRKRKAGRKSRRFLKSENAKNPKMETKRHNNENGNGDPKAENEKGIPPSPFHLSTPSSTRCNLPP